MDREKFIKILSAAGISALCLYIVYLPPVWQYVRPLFTLSIPFLLVTVVFPILAIMGIIIRKPITEYRLPYEPNHLSKTVFGISLFFFVLVQSYCIYDYRLRIQGGDSLYDLLFYSHGDLLHSGIPDHSWLRLNCILNKMLLIPAFWFHLPLAAIARIYCLNDALTYLAAAVAILFFTRRYDMAAVVLAAPLLIAGPNFFFINTEIIFSGSIMILYIAVYNGLKDGALKNLILFPCAFFMIWSHPVNILVLAVFLAGTYKTVDQIIKDRWLVIFIVFNVVIKLLKLSGYDHQRMLELFGGMNWDSLVRFVTVYCLLYWYIILLGLACIRISIRFHLRLSDYAGLLIIPFILYFCMVEKVHADPVNLAKFTYPINLFILLQGTAILTQYGGNYKKRILRWTFGILFLNVSGICFSGYMNYVKLRRVLETINQICLSEDPKQSKWYICDDSIRQMGIGSATDCILYSSYNKLPITIDVVAGGASIKKILDKVPEDVIYIAGYDTVKNTETMDDLLSPRYFHFHRGPYKELVLDSAKLAMIRKAGE